MRLNIHDKLKFFRTAGGNVLGTIFPNYHVDPPAIVWLMTNKCNCACKHCDLWQKKADINVEKIMIIAEKIAKSKAAIVNLSGGEVFLVPNIKDVIRLLKKSGKYIRINTNGLAIEEYLDFLIEQKVDSLVFSIDSLIPSQHDENRGVENVYSKCLKAFEYIKMNKVGGKPEVSIRCVLMKNNIDQISKYIEYFSSKVDEISFQPIHDDSDKHKVVNSAVLFDSADEQSVRDIVDSLVAKYSFLDNSYFRSFPDFIFHPERLSKSAVNFCLPILYNTLSIDTEGNCKVCTESVGNIFENGLSEIWASSARKNFLSNLVIQSKCITPCWLNSTSAKTPIMGSAVKILVRAMR